MPSLRSNYAKLARSIWARAGVVFFMPKVTVYDKSGKPYSVSQVEAQAMLESGAYFESSKGAVHMPAAKSPLITIYDVKTGKPIQRRPVDARELVKSGDYVLALAKKKSPAASDTGSGQIPPEADPSAHKRQANDVLPVLSEESSKEEIMAVLSRFGIQYRINMSKMDLLNLWQTYVLERGQA